MFPQLEQTNGPYAHHGFEEIWHNSKQLASHLVALILLLLGDQCEPLFNFFFLHQSDTFAASVRRQREAPLSSR